MKYSLCNNKTTPTMLYPGCVCCVRGVIGLFKKNKLFWFSVNKSNVK